MGQFIYLYSMTFVCVFIVLYCVCNIALLLLYIAKEGFILNKSSFCSIFICCTFKVIDNLSGKKYRKFDSQCVWGDFNLVTGSYRVVKRKENRVGDHHPSLNYTTYVTFLFNFLLYIYIVSYNSINN